MATVTTKERNKPGWQAKKSAMTRGAILDAAISCYVTLGYAETTTAKIADKAQVSRGAMLHHFPSKTELVQASVEHLHDKMIALYERTIKRVTRDLDLDERNRRGLQGYWKFLKSDLYTAHHELCVAGRTDKELRSILQASMKKYDEQRMKTNSELFPEWASRGELYDLAMEITKFLMEGMANSDIVRPREKSVKRMLEYLGDRLEEVFHEGDDDDTAIYRHSSGK
ncbi:MAG: AcrR family transcriptional regulator [Halieaceae bacterium]|jgi:AcrR family transcriptional regulator